MSEKVTVEITLGKEESDAIRAVADHAGVTFDQAVNVMMAIAMRGYQTENIKDEPDAQFSAVDMSTAMAEGYRDSQKAIEEPNL